MTAHWTFKIFLQVYLRCVKSGAMLDTVDACSLLYRLELEGEILLSLKIQIENNKTSPSLSRRNVTVKMLISVFHLNTFAFNTLINAGFV